MCSDPALKKILNQLDTGKGVDDDGSGGNMMDHDGTNSNSNGLSHGRKGDVSSKGENSQVCSMW